MDKAKKFVSDAYNRVKSVSPSRVAVAIGIINHVAVFAIVVANQFDIAIVAAAAAEVYGVTQQINQWLKGRSSWEQVIEQISATK